MKIVVRGTNWIGDAVMSVPALRELRRIFPDAHISLHTRSWAKGLFEDADFIDEIIPFDREKNSLQTIRKQARIWRKKNFDLAVLFTNSFQTALLAKLGGAKKRFGYKNEGRSFLLTHSIKKPDWKDHRHEAFYYLNLVSEVSKNYFTNPPELPSELNVSLKIIEKRRTKAKKMLEEKGVDLYKKTVALGVGSANSRAKRWQARSYAKLNDKLQKDLNVNVILVGSSDELDIGMKVIAYSEVKPVSIIGKTDLSEAVSVLAVCDVLVSNDMGLAHIAPAVGTKALTIFGPTNPKTTRPIGGEILINPVECAPCMLRDCPIDHPCMTGISAEMVFEKVVEML